MAMLRGPEHVFELCNQSYFRLAGQREILGRPVREVFPELEGQGFFELLDEVYGTGTPHVSTAAPIDLQRDAGRSAGAALSRFHLPADFRRRRARSAGIFAEGHDVTEQVEGQAQLALSEELLRLATSGRGRRDLGPRSDHRSSDLVRPHQGDVRHFARHRRAAWRISMPGCILTTLDATSEAFASALDPQRRATYDVEYRTVGKEDGIVRWVAAKGKGLFDGERCIRAIGTAIDITARKAAEQALRQTEKELRAETRALQTLNRAGATRCGQP